MRHKEAIYLLSATITEDDWGNQVETFEERMVYANEYAVSANEFYEARQNELRPEKSFEIYSFEYKGEKKLKYTPKGGEEQEYSIIRTQTKGDKAILTCEVKGSDV